MTGINPKDLVGAKKAPLRLVPPALLIGAAEALATGAVKYGPYNWRQYPVTAMTYVEAAQRHLIGYVEGEDLAQDTLVHHVKHAVAGLAILLDCIEAGTLVDDRPPPGPGPKMLDDLDRSDRTVTVDVTAFGDPEPQTIEVEVPRIEGPETRFPFPEEEPGDFPTAYSIAHGSQEVGFEEVAGSLDPAGHMAVFEDVGELAPRDTERARRARAAAARLAGKVPAPEARLPLIGPEGDLR